MRSSGLAVSVLTVLFAAFPDLAAAQLVHGPLIEPGTLTFKAGAARGAASLAAPAAVLSGGATGADLRRTDAPLPARSLSGYLCEQAREAILHGMLAKEDDARQLSYATAEKDARKALALSPASLDARYWLAAAEGMQAGNVGLKHRLELGRDIYRLAASILEADPDNAGGHYLMGRLNMEIMKMGGLSRFIAGNLLGADLIRQASWEAAERHLLAAVQAQPRSAMDRLTLARMYAATGRDAQARAQITVLFQATDPTPITPLLEDRAHALLHSLGPAR